MEEMGRRRKQSQNPRSKAQLRLSFGHDREMTAPLADSKASPPTKHPTLDTTGRAPSDPLPQPSVLAGPVGDDDDSPGELAGSRSKSAADRVREAALTMARAKLRTLFSQSTTDAENEGS